MQNNHDHTLAKLMADFPGVTLKLSYNKGWLLAAHGPCASVTVALPEPLRDSNLREACRLVSRSNCQRRP